MDFWFGVASAFTNPDLTTSQTPHNEFLFDI
jgi:hypothetical protein